MATAKPAHRFDSTFTQKCIDAIGPNVPDRTRFVMGKLIQHIHDFAREVELTNDEWMAGVHFINSIGQISTPQRNEAHRMSDVLGLESLVDEIAHHHISESGETPTSSTILGPFWSPNAPWRAHGDSIIMSPHNGEVSLMHGYIRDLDTKKPIANATFDIWEASSNGKYDFQDPDGQVPNNLRGKFKTDANGYYRLYCLKPTAYSLPMDGPSGVMFRLLDRSPWRPAHIHLMMSADGYKTVVTQLYPKEDPHLIDDSVFAVKPDLVVDFTPLEGDSKAKLELKYDVYLAPKDAKGEAAARATDGIPASKI